MEETSTSQPRYISTANAAKRLGVTPAFVRSLLGTEVEGARFGRSIKVEVASLEAYRQRQTIGPRS